jgi:hypothetical protein
VNFEKPRGLIHCVAAMDFDAPCMEALHRWPAVSMRFRISSTRQAVMRGLSLTDLGKRPDFTPAHQVDLLTGMIAGIGGSAVESPMI